MSVQYLTVDNDPWESNSAYTEPPPQPIKLPADPVACACASYRTWRENPTRRWADLETVVVWQDDIEEAERLKKYYRDNMVIEALKSANGVARSSFRQKLAQLVVNELVITKKEIGLLMRLPYFYEEDRQLDEIQTVVDSSRVGDRLTTLANTELTPLKRVLVSRRSGELYHYWFTDANNTPYNLVVRHDNPLLSLLNGLWKQPVLKINANLYPKEMRGHRKCKYYQLGGVELA